MCFNTNGYNSLFAICVLAVFMLNFGCKPKTYNCKCFNPEIVWAPYKANDLVYFKEKKNTQPSFFFKQLIINDFGSTEDYYYSQKRLLMAPPARCKCDYSARDKKNNFIWSLYSRTYADKNLRKTKVYNLPFVKTLNISFHDFSLQMNIDSNKVEINDSNMVEVLKNVQVGNNLYQEVYAIKIDTLKFPKQNYWKMLITKDNGMISYFTRSPKEEWIRQ